MPATFHRIGGQIRRTRTDEVGKLSLVPKPSNTIIVCAALIYFLSCGNLYAQDSPQAASDSGTVLSLEKLDELDARIDSSVAHNSIPGVAVAIVSEDSIIWIRTYGLANITTGESITENTHFCLASCSKSFTGVAFLKLLDVGRVDLHTLLRDIIPEIEIDNPWEDTHPLKIIHLLEHTTGFDDIHLNWYYFDRPVLSLREALEIKADILKVRWPPGTRFGYSGVGYTIAGYILEKISGKPFGEFIEQSILDSIGMVTSTMGGANENRQLLAAGYTDSITPIPHYYCFDEPAGAMNSSIKEMANFLQFILKRGKAGNDQFISAESMDLIGISADNPAAQAGIELGYSFGVGSWYRNSQVWSGHAGLTPGYYADYRYSLDCGLGYIVLLNVMGNIVYSGLIDLPAEYLNCEMKRKTVPAADIPLEQLESYCGYYEPRSPRMALAEFSEILFDGITIFVEGDSLYYQRFMADKTALIPVSDSLFRRAGEPDATRAFIKTFDGRLAFVSSRSYYERTSNLKPLMHRAFFFGAWCIILSSLVYAIIWVPLWIYKRIKRKVNLPPYLMMRLVPLAAIVSLVLGGLAFANQTFLELSQPGFRNVMFYLATLFFAAFSLLSLYTSWRSFRKPVKTIARIYAVILSLSCAGMTLYLSYWGIIGLRAWAY
jgi:CubicO group peptidase (beta-lactamase class C family)